MNDIFGSFFLGEIMSNPPNVIFSKFKSVKFSKSAFQNQTWGTNVSVEDHHWHWRLVRDSCQCRAADDCWQCVARPKQSSDTSTRDMVDGRKGLRIRLHYTLMDFVRRCNTCLYFLGLGPKPNKREMCRQTVCRPGMILPQPQKFERLGGHLHHFN